MIAILTADIINSAAHEVPRWIEPLKAYLSRYGESPVDWDIYRGDELQLRVPPEQALEAAIGLKALVRSHAGMDIRVGIGLGTETHRAPRVAESNGSAYRNSGRLLEALGASKLRMQVKSDCTEADPALNLMLKLALHFMDQWSQVSAEAIGRVLAHPEASQTDIARQLGIRQSAVSQRQSRARLDLVRDLLAYYRSDYLKTLEACS